MKKSRKQKFLNCKNPPSLSDLLKEIEKNNNNKNRIAEWRSRDIIVGKDIPGTGGLEEYVEFAYIQKIVEMFESWKAKNYGKLSILLTNLFSYERSEKLRPKECRELFQDKDFITFKILEIEDRAISLKRILVEVNWKVNEKYFTEELEFGVVYQSADNKPLIPFDEEGDWIIVPWKVQGLYKL